MFTINDNYLKLQGSYLFSNIAKKVAAFQERNPGAEIIRLGIGDVTQPLAPAIIEALHKAVDEMGNAATFHGYAPDKGYEFLRHAIVENDYKARGCEVYEDEIFVSDGAKCDCGNIQEIFGLNNKVAVCDPVYPVYVDSNVMAGRTGLYNPTNENYDGVIYMPCLSQNNFVPELPKEEPDLIYLCFPNNPTGAGISKENLQRFVDYARKIGAVILYDAAYEAYISDPDMPHSIYECEGARECAIELRSFSKNAGFTGVRLGYTVVPKDLKSSEGVKLNDLWARRSSLHRSESRRSCLFPGRKGAAEDSDRLLYEECEDHSSGLERRGIYGLRRRERPLYLAENSGFHELMGVFRSPAFHGKYRGNAGKRFWCAWRRLLPTDCIWNL